MKQESDAQTLEKMTNRNPIEASFIFFKELCNQRKVKAYFKQDDLLIHEFFCDQSKPHLSLFQGYHFYHLIGERPFSDKLDGELSSMRMARLIVPWSNDYYEAMNYFNPQWHMILKQLRPVFQQMGEKFYNEVGCNDCGTIGRHTMIRAS